jgi:hypothetical protein
VDGVVIEQTDDPKATTPQAPASSTPAKAKLSDEDKAALLKALRDDMQLSADASKDQREKALADRKFEAGEHWTEADIKDRELKHKPTFTIDHISGQVQQVTNQPVQRIVVTAVGRNADPDTAEYWQGYCRRVENLSNAEDIYKSARRDAAIGGVGYWRIRADVFSMPEFTAGAQLDASIFNQDLRIEAILNPDSVYDDPRCRTLDFSDMRFGHIAEDLEWSTIQRLWPDAEITTNDELVRAAGDALPFWANGNVKTGRIIERYYIEDQTFTACMLANGSVVLKGKGDEATYPDAAILREHTFRVPKVKWFKSLAGVTILEGPVDVPGRYIPIVKIVGERRAIDGKTDYRGMVRMAKDPARLLDFMETRLAQAVDIGTLDTWLVAAESVDTYTEWDDLANGERPARLRYKSTDETHPDGERLPAPNHISAAPIVAPIVAAATRATMNLRHVLGTPDVAPDERTSEQSGKAINLRLQQQQQSTSHYAEATGGGIRLTGRIIMSQARQILDVPQVLRILDKKEAPVEVVAYSGANPAHEGIAQDMAQQAPQGPTPDEQVRKLLRVDVGEFDVDVTAGKGYQTGRQESVEAITGIIQAFPPAAPKLIPIALKNSDWPGAQEAAALLAPDQKSGTVPVEQAMQAQQVIDGLTERLKAAEQELQSKQAELQNEAAIAESKNQNQLAIEQMKIQGQIELAKLNATIEIQKAEIQAQKDVEVAKLQPPPAPEGDSITVHQGGQ